ncbi:hypothetical protein [Shewanella algicola]|uniref:hypothetical protein n=1 Tax=Shewanella algicola TaxID=640633 RepID=UPI00249425ED|nr:hypothetical protein [Shewanella algicola]
MLVGVGFSLWLNELNETTAEVEIITAPPTVMNIAFAQAVTLTAMAIKNNNGYILNLDVQVPKVKKVRCFHLTLQHLAG